MSQPFWGDSTPLNLDNMKKEVEQAERTTNAKKVNTSLSKLLKGRAKKPMADSWQDDSSRNNSMASSLRPSNIFFKEAKERVS